MARIRREAGFYHHRCPRRRAANATSRRSIQGTYSFSVNVTVPPDSSRHGDRRVSSGIGLGHHLIDGLHGGDTSYRSQLNYNADRYGFRAERLVIGPHFDPAIGFFRRVDFEKTHIHARFSPRPEKIRSIRRIGYQTTYESYVNTAGVRETREILAEFFINFENSDRLLLAYQDNYEFLTTPFAIADNVTVPAGAYTLRISRAQFTIGQQRTVSGTLSLEHGPFYGGDRTAFRYRGARVKLNARLALEPGVSVNLVSLPYGDFTTKLLTSRVTYTITPRMFLNGLVQYNSSNSSFTTNARLRWEYRPGSELFVVYNEGRDT